MAVKELPAAWLDEPPQRYRGAETCNFRPIWDCSLEDIDLLGLLNSCYDVDPDELTPLLMLADLLDERNDSRAMWVRVTCDLWTAIPSMSFTTKTFDRVKFEEMLRLTCETYFGRRVGCLWSYLVMWHAPSGYTGKVMGRTWVDARLRAASRTLLWWALDFVLDNSSVCDAASLAHDVWGSRDTQEYITRFNCLTGGMGSTISSLSDSVDSLGVNQRCAAVNQADAVWYALHVAMKKIGGFRYDNSASWLVAGVVKQVEAVRNQVDAAIAHNRYAMQDRDEWERQLQVWKQGDVWGFVHFLWMLCESKFPLLR